MAKDTRKNFMILDGAKRMNGEKKLHLPTHISEKTKEKKPPQKKKLNK